MNEMTPPLNRNRLFATGLLAIASLFLGSASASATLGYNEYDLFLGFRASGGVGSANDYLVDIGSAGNFTPNSSFSLNVGNIGADLSSTGISGLFGPTWNQRSDVFWGIAGGLNLAGDAANTLYATRARSDPLTQSTPWTRNTGSSQSGTGSKISAAQQYYGNNGVATANSTVATLQPSSGGPLVTSWATYQPGGTNGSGISFGAWNPSVEGDFTNGTSQSVLDLYQITPKVGVGSPPATYLGKFTINDSGTVTWTGSAVPEPSSLTLLVFASLSIGLVRVRSHPMHLPLSLAQGASTKK